MRSSTVAGGCPRRPRKSRRRSRSGGHVAAIPSTAVPRPGGQEIGGALGLAQAADRANQTLALAAWRYAGMRVTPDEPDPEWAYRSYGRGPTADWRCRTCTGAVHEGHPDNGPVDAEQGHKPDCA